MLGSGLASIFVSLSVAGGSYHILGASIYFPHDAPCVLTFGAKDIGAFSAMCEGDEFYAWHELTNPHDFPITIEEFRWRFPNEPEIPFVTIATDITLQARETKTWIVGDDGTVAGDKLVYHDDPGFTFRREIIGIEYSQACPPTICQSEEELDSDVNIIVRCADINSDWHVDGLDLGLLLAAWGTPAPSQACSDLDRDGDVDGLDLGVLLAEWGTGVLDLQRE